MGECVGSVKLFGGSGSEVWRTGWECVGSEGVWGSGSEVWSTRWGSVKVFEGKGSGVWRTRWGNVWGV